MAKQQLLTENFIIELFKSSLTNQNVLEVLVKHLEDHFLPEESYKNLWRGIKGQFELTNKMPTIGTLNERFKSDQPTLDLLIQVKRCKIPDIENIFPLFERFIKEVRFTVLYAETAKLWNKSTQEAQDEAIKHLAKESDEINSFSLKEGIFAKVFANFEERQEKRRNTVSEEIVKVPLGIAPMDYDTRGGGKIGTSGLILGRSGTGKTTLLRWTGINSARLGLRVVAFEIEGTEAESLQAYDAGWTGTNLEDMEFGGISKDMMMKVKDVNQDIINKGGEIFVISAESFDSLSLESCEETIEAIENKYGKVSLVTFDNIELFNVKGKFPNSEMGERKRREALGNKITTIAIKKKLFALATTQANDIKPDKFNNPDFVMSRSDISEFKGMIKPFSYFWTWNLTADEAEANVGRIYNDKFRYHKSGNVRKVCTSFESGRFYNSSKTYNTFWDSQSNKPL